MCPGATAIAQLEVFGRLNRMVSKDISGPRTFVTLDYVEGRRLEAWRACASAALACPPSLRERLQPIASSTSTSTSSSVNSHLTPGTRGSVSAGSRHSVSQNMSPRDIIQILVGRLYGPPGALQSCSVLVLGHMSPAFYDDLLQELLIPMEEYSRGLAPTRVLWGSAKARPEDLRRSVAHVFRWGCK